MGKTQTKSVDKSWNSGGSISDISSLKNEENPDISELFDADGGESFADTSNSDGDETSDDDANSDTAAEYYDRSRSYHIDDRSIVKSVIRRQAKWVLPDSR